MTSLPQVTMICVDTINYGQAVNAIQKSLKEITPLKTIFFTDIQMDPKFIGENVEIVQIPHIYNKSEYSKWMMKELGKHKFDTSHILIIQNDGWVVDGEMWTDDFLNYDYLGAVWPETDGYSVGNGGFSLRSERLHRFLAEDTTILGVNPEDVGICRIYRNYLEEKYGIVFAPEELAHRFSYELYEPRDRHFGFHGKFHPPYKEPVVIKRTAALGDVIQVEPVLEWFHNQGHPVYLDTLPGFYELFGRHHFKVGNAANFDRSVVKHKFINLDLAYETNPKQLHLKSYFEMAGIKDYELRNPRLNWTTPALFNKYVILHVDERETTHRNAYGVDWSRIVHFIQDKGYQVIQVGKGRIIPGAVHFNTFNEVMLMWAISRCEFFIGMDSGPAQIAVATGRKAVIMFGSVNPAYIHHDMSKIAVVQSKCPIGKDGCWHLTPGTTGTECEVDQDQPPCCIYSNSDIKEAIEKVLTK